MCLHKELEYRSEIVLPTTAPLSVRHLRLGSRDVLGRTSEGSWIGSATAVQMIPENGLAVTYSS